MIDDPATGGTSYGYSTSLVDASGPGKVYLGSYLTPSASDTGGGGGGYGDPNCVAASAYLAGCDEVAAAAMAGDPLWLLGSDWSRIVEGRVTDNALHYAECLTLITETGIALTMAVNTPMPVEGGYWDVAINCLHRSVAVVDHGAFRWERVTRIDLAGVRAVAAVECGNGSFAAGDAVGRYILSHNGFNKP